MCVPKKRVSNLHARSSECTQSSQKSLTDTGLLLEGICGSNSTTWFLLFVTCHMITYMNVVQKR